MRSDDFFIESTYQAGTGKLYKHYLLTKQGCEIVANKMTGEKGVLFTVRICDPIQRNGTEPTKLLESLAHSFNR
ncbi:Rha family transcriptional regulator [Bacillus sp. SL00103]